MKSDYIYIVTIFFIFICFARYMRWRDLREMGESSQTRTHEEKANLRVIQGVNYKLGVHNQRFKLRRRRRAVNFYWKYVRFK